MLPGAGVPVTIPEIQQHKSKKPKTSKEQIEAYERLLRHGFIGPNSIRTVGGIFKGE
jgi:hypothetical protein